MERCLEPALKLLDESDPKSARPMLPIQLLQTICSTKKLICQNTRSPILKLDLRIGINAR